MLIFWLEEVFDIIEILCTIMWENACGRNIFFGNISCKFSKLCGNISIY